jgi:hypothetical protein
MNITSSTARISIGGGERAAGCEGCLGTVRLPFRIRQDRDRYLPEGSPHPPSLRGAHERWYGTARHLIRVLAGAPYLAVLTVSIIDFQDPPSSSTLVLDL